jgi:hypothetical protein
MSLIDGDQYITKTIKGYRGNPINGRLYMTFLIEYEDGDTVWTQFSNDLRENTTFMSYVSSIPELITLSNTREFWTSKLKEIDKTPIDAHITTFYLDIRTLGTNFTWYDNLNLPDADTTTYRTIAKIERLNNKRRANVLLPEFGPNEKLLSLPHSWFYIHACVRQLKNFTLVDRRFIRKFPQILNMKPHELETHFSTLEPAIAGTYAERRGSYSSRRSSEK